MHALVVGLTLLSLALVPSVVTFRNCLRAGYGYAGGAFGALLALIVTFAVIWAMTLAYVVGRWLFFAGHGP